MVCEQLQIEIPTNSSELGTMQMFGWKSQYIIDVTASTSISSNVFILPAAETSLFHGQGLSLDIEPSLLPVQEYETICLIS